MQASSYNRYMRAKLQIPIMALLVAMILWLIVVGYGLETSSEFKQANDKDKQLTNELADLQEDLQRTKEAYRIWSSTNQNKLNADGLQVEEAKKILDELSNTYLITSMMVNVSSPIIRNDYKNKLTQLQYSVISLDCSAYTDESIFNFLNALMNTMPGYLQIKDMRLANSMAVTPEVLKGIAEGNYKDLVKAQVQLIWQEVQAIKPGG